MNCNVITKYYSLIVTNADLSRQLYANDDVKFFGSDKYIPLHVIQQREMEGKGIFRLLNHVRSSDCKSYTKQVQKKQVKE